MYNKKGIFGLAIELIILIGISRSIIQNNLEKTQSDITIEDAGEENSRTEEEISLAETDDLTGNCKWIYDHWTDFLEEKSIPCVDVAAFQVIQHAYDEIDFYGEFKKGNEEYRNYFINWILENKPLQDMSTGEDIYIKDTDHNYEQYEYYFFDMDEDGFPELTVRSNTFIYVLKYDAATRECFLWKAVRGTWYAVLGSLKVMWLWDGKYWSYSQFNQNGEVVCETFLMQKYGNTPCFAMMPEYAAEEKKIPISKEMKAQGIYERGTGYWYFRVTKEQYNELIADCVDAEEFASYQRQEVVYKYEEFFE